MVWYIDLMAYVIILRKKIVMWVFKIQRKWNIMSLLSQHPICICDLCMLMHSWLMEIHGHKRSSPPRPFKKKPAATLLKGTVLKSNTSINRIYKKEGYFHILGPIYLMRRKKLSFTYLVSITGFLGSLSEISISACYYRQNPGEFHYWYSNLYTGRVHRDVRP